ncbi:MAG: hypothetical protein LBL37_05460 [Gracilibacteraceae bacterium]|jgi:ribosomal protein S27E|nr:hypothetical protein [Gracilibacteraceae bacterium]
MTEEGFFMNNDMLPVPKHLKRILKLTGDSNSEFEVTGKIVCDCGSEKFTLRLVGDDSDYQKHRVIKVAQEGDNYFLIVKVKCNDCGREHLIFDNDHHGWNGFVCGGDSRDLPRPAAKDWACDKCQKTDHALTVIIHSRGQEDFIKEGEDEFDPEDWAEAFAWITIKTVCGSCGETNDEWISYETM